MGDYNIIANIGSVLIDKIRAGLVPDLVQSKESISLCGGGDDFVVSLVLYDIELLSRTFFKESSFSAPMALKYVLGVKSKANADVKAVSEHRILGRAISVLNELPVLKKESGLLSDSDMPAEITMDNVDVDGKIKICEHAFGGYRTSVFYKVSPVFIDSSLGLFGGKAARILNG